MRETEEEPGKGGDTGRESGKRQEGKLEEAVLRESQKREGNTRHLREGLERKNVKRDWEEGAAIRM